MTTRREITPLDIKRIRGVMCLTQREFAALLGVSHDYLKAVECGQVNLSLNMLLRLKYHVNTYAFDECVRELNVIVDELRNHVGVN